MDLEIFFPGNKKVFVDTGEFVIETDQSLKSGGDASAPQPFDLFLASIGACSGIYVLSFCQSRNIATEGIRLRLSTQYDQAKKLIDQITLTVELPSDFPEHYIQPVLRSAEFCAVSKHLYNPPQIKLEAKIMEQKTA